MSAKFYGKHRGVVLNNRDPMQKGRLLVEVPDVLGPTASAWAEACVPLAGPTGLPMGVYLAPPIGTQVWIEFERGDPDYPIWVGCLWDSSANIPVEALMSPSPELCIVIQTAGRNVLEISDSSPTAATGGIVLKSSNGAMITVNGLGILIQNGKGASINLVGPTVDINAGALTIT
jgi:uncharacterized protein involved in type VI secretion and phage assembly